MLFSNINLNQVEQAQSNKEVTLNAAIEALAKHAGNLDKAVTAGGTINLTEDESRYGVKNLTGTPGSTTTVVQDADVTVASVYVNNTTTGQIVKVKIGSGTEFIIPAGKAILLMSTTAALFLTREAVQLIFNSVTATWTDQPAGNTELFGLTDRRTKFDLTRFTEVRLVANVEVAGVTGAKLRGEYSTNESAWNDIENGGGSGPEVAIDATGTQVSSWVLIPSGAQADVFLRIVGIDGDGAGDPDLGLIALQFR